MLLLDSCLLGADTFCVTHLLNVAATIHRGEVIFVFGTHDNSHVWSESGRSIKPIGVPSPDDYFYFSYYSLAVFVGTADHRSF